jgi:hypothetical protein
MISQWKPSHSAIKQQHVFEAKACPGLAKYRDMPEYGQWVKTEGA